MKIAAIDPLDEFSFTLLLRFVRSMRVLAILSAAGLVRGMKTNVGPSHPCKDTKRAVMHNANIAPSSTACYNTTLQVYEKSFIYASRGHNDILCRRADFQETSIAPPPGDTASCAYSHATGHYLDGCSNFSALNMNTKRHFITEER